jgi:ribosome-associated protein
VAEEIAIAGASIRLGQLLKLAGEIDSGAQAKRLLAEETVLVNGQPDARRGRQLVPGDRVELAGRRLLLVGSTPARPS